jgi:hypothetical protein
MEDVEESEAGGPGRGFLFCVERLERAGAGVRRRKADSGVNGTASGQAVVSSSYFCCAVLTR